jgi:hypothetical protein
MQGVVLMTDTEDRDDEVEGEEEEGGETRTTRKVSCFPVSSGYV